MERSRRRREGGSLNGWVNVRVRANEQERLRARTTNAPRGTTSHLSRVDSHAGRCAWARLQHGVKVQDSRQQPGGRQQAAGCSMGGGSRLQAAAWGQGAA